MAFRVIIGRFILKKTIYLTLPPLSLFFLAKLKWCAYVTIARFQCHKIGLDISISKRGANNSRRDYSSS
jgi:hypothetical protein